MSSSAQETRLMEKMGEAARPATPYLADLRAHARAAFEERGLPNRRVEEWKYSDLARALADPQIADDLVRPSPAIAGGEVAVFDNGVYNAAESNITSCAIVPLRAVLADPFSPYAELIGRINPQKDHAVIDLNAALMEDGLVLHVPAGKRHDAPIHLRFRWSRAGAPAPEGRHLRILVLMDEAAEAVLVETHDGNPGFASIVSEIELAQRARLAHVRIERLGAGARQAAVSLGALARDAVYRAVYFSEGGQFVRHEALMRLEGEGAEVHIDGAYLAAGQRHCDNTTIITHAVPKTLSRQAFRGVLAGEGRGVYQGKVSVSPDAQGTDARQSSRALLLSHKAFIATKPELEILADDVKCAHGASAGDLDADAIFFLRARGIPEAEARALLIDAFLSETVEVIPNELLRAFVQGEVGSWLSAHAGEVSHVD